jgi:hypothetical protein
MLNVRGKGVECATPASTTERFWLPKASVKWSEPPAPGAKLSVSLPRWLAERNPQLLKLRGQYGLPLTPEPELNPAIATKEGSFPMADSSYDLRGALFRNDRKESEKHPDYKGDITIDGRKFWLSGWIKEGKRGKFLSLAAKPAEEQSERQRQEPQQNSYAAARGRDEPQRQQQRPAGGQSFADTDIPFAPEGRG